MNYAKLVEFYRRYNLVESGLNDKDLENYFYLLDGRGNLIVEHDTLGEVIGFMENWRINYEQLGRIIVHKLIDARVEDTEHGNICFVANLAIHPEHRGLALWKKLHARFLKENFSCEYFSGHSQRKSHHKTFNIYKRNELFLKTTKEEVSNHG